MKKRFEGLRGDICSLHVIFRSIVCRGISYDSQTGCPVLSM